MKEIKISGLTDNQMWDVYSLLEDKKCDCNFCQYCPFNILRCTANEDGDWEYFFNHFEVLNIDNEHNVITLSEL